MKITVSKQFQDLIYPLTDEEFYLLKENILKQGVRDPLVVWQNGKNYLIDGHHRYRIISTNKIKNYKINKLKFKNKDEVSKWIIENQLGRRNATPEAVSYLRGLRYKLEKKTHGGDRLSSPQNGDLLSTSEELAAKYRVSKNTIQRDEQYTDAIDTICAKYDTREQQKIKNKILSRQTKLSKRDIIDIVASRLGIRHIKQVISGIKELWQVKLEIVKKSRSKKKKLPRIILPKDIKLHHGDALKILPTLKKNSIDL